jgi:site-specific recombinase XerD
MLNYDSIHVLIKEYINYLDLKPITKESYQRILLEYAKFVERLNEPPTREDVKTYRDNLLHSRPKRKPTTVQKYIVVIRNFYAWLYAEKKGDNIAIGIKGAKIESSFKREPLSSSMAKKLVDFAKSESNKGILQLRNYLMIALMLTTGMRTIEVSRADTTDIHIVDDDYALFVQGKGRDGKDNYVKLAPHVYTIIMEYLEARADEYDPLFINHGRNQKEIRISTRTISKTIKEYLKDIGIDSEKYTAHSLRHTAATMAMREGAGIHSTQQLLRHKNPNTTQIYVSTMNRREEFFEKAISDRLFGDSHE